MSKYIACNYLNYDNQNKLWSLHEDFIMAFRYSDGFTERLLSADFFIDKNFKLLCYLGSFDKFKDSTEHGLHFVIETHLPNDIRQLVSSLMKEKYDFEKFVMTDMPDVQVYLKSGVDTKSVYINYIMLSDTDDILEFMSEKKLFKLTSKIVGWINDCYESLVKK
ncbi:hypothetical protein [Apibacter sp. HY039]|uniref:hypothetical protein n=1 Tax=Apibacter sp. HY039 TaxID=2501476 RepID=UPI000FEB8755|nr:hypothetical protein [Apibacter sp. HY039]